MRLGVHGSNGSITLKPCGSPSVRAAPEGLWPRVRSGNARSPVILPPHAIGFPAMRSTRFMLALGLGMALDLLASGVSPAQEPISFRTQIAPILVEHCVACHSAKKAEGGYRIDTFTELSKPGDSGVATLTPQGDFPGELLRRLITEDESERMPEQSDPLTMEQIELVRGWLAAGANFDAPSPDEPLAFVIPPPRYPDPPANYAGVIPVTAIAFTPAGDQVLVGGYHEITVWNVADGQLARRIPNLGQRIFAIAVSPDGTKLAAACGEPGRGGEVRIVDFVSGEVTAVVGRSADVALDVAFRPNSNQLAIAAADSLIRIVDLTTLETVRTLASHADWVTALAWRADGQRLVSASRDKSAKVFDGETGELLTSYQGHGAPVRGVIVTPDGQHVLSTGNDNRIHRWELTGGKQIAVIPVGAEGFRLSPGGDGFVLVPLADKRLVRIDLSTNAVGQTFTGLSDWAMVSAWHGATGRIAAGDYSGQVRVWELGKADWFSDWMAKP